MTLRHPCSSRRVLSQTQVVLHVITGKKERNFLRAELVHHLFSFEQHNKSKVLNIKCKFNKELGVLLNSLLIFLYWFIFFSKGFNHRSGKSKVHWFFPVLSQFQLGSPYVSLDKSYLETTWRAGATKSVEWLCDSPLEAALGVRCLPLVETPCVAVVLSQQSTTKENQFIIRTV